MERRLQQVNDDTVLEITETKPVKTRLSEKQLLRQQAYLESAITRFNEQLSDVKEKLAMIYAEKDRK